MTVYEVLGRISGLTTPWMKRLGWKKIKSITANYSNELVIEMKEGLDARIRFLEPGQACIVWSVEDFEHRANERDGEYDESKFENALEQMIHKHDATLGISWDTIDFWLDELCLKTEENDKN